MRKSYLIVVVAFALLLLAGCAAGPNPAAHTAASDGEIAGFWLGLWHGIISPIAFVVSLFSDNVHLYEVHNNGGWYNFGFLIGASVSLVGGTNATSPSRSRSEYTVYREKTTTRLES